MDLNLKGKRALVTGASYGLGYACAKSLSEEGAQVVLSSRSKDKIAKAAAEITQITDNAVHGITCDLTSDKEMDALVEETGKLLGGIDILIVSTGHPPTLPFSVATDEDWRSGTELVLHPPIYLSRLVLKQMQKRKYGRIIYIGSIFGLEPEATSVVQSTLRTGLNALAKCIATEVAPHGVTVNVLCPGYFDTPLVRELAKQYADSQHVSPEEVIASWEAYSPTRCFGKPEDLGALTAFLSSPRGEFITGTAITVDGGALKSY